MEWAVPVILFIGYFIYFTLNRVGTKKGFPYKIKNTLFSPAERSFLGVLTLASSDSAIVFGKVRVADILEPVRELKRGEWQSAFNKISSKHFDFIICTPDDLSVLSVIELDDKSHNRRKQVLRDEFLQGACDSAGLKLHRFKANSSYSITEVKEILFPSEASVAIVDKQSPSLSKEHEEQFKLCPKCSSELVFRTSNKGNHKGEKFFGCSSFPKCRYTLKLDE